MDLFETPQQNIPKVSELTQRIKVLLEQHFTNISVLGELSNVKEELKRTYLLHIKRFRSPATLCYVENPSSAIRLLI